MPVTAPPRFFCLPTFLPTTHAPHVPRDTHLFRAHAAFCRYAHTARDTAAHSLYHTRTPRLSTLLPRCGLFFYRAHTRCANHRHTPLPPFAIAVLVLCRIHLVCLAFAFRLQLILGPVPTTTAVAFAAICRTCTLWFCRYKKRWTRVTYCTPVATLRPHTFSLPPFSCRTTPSLHTVVPACLYLPFHTHIHIRTHTHWTFTHLHWDAVAFPSLVHLPLHTDTHTFVGTHSCTPVAQRAMRLRGNAFALPHALQRRGLFSPGSSSYTTPARNRCTRCAAYDVRARLLSVLRRPARATLCATVRLLRLAARR